MIGAWYLDDGALVGPAEHVADALRIIQQEGPALGLHLNLPKCEVWWPFASEADFALFPPEVARVREDGLDLLGAPLCGTDFAEAYVGKRVAKIEAILDKVQDLDNSHCELTLIRSCIGFPKFAFALRTCPPCLIPKAIARFDKSIRETLSVILGPGELTVNIQLQISLPASKGGLGIPSAALLAAPAYIASAVASLSIQRELVGDAEFTDVGVLECLDGFQSFLKSGLGSKLSPEIGKVFDATINEKEGVAVGPRADDAITPTNPMEDELTLEALLLKPKCQRFLSSLVAKHSFAQIYHSVSEMDKARLVSLLQPYAGTWVLALPLKAIKLCMSTRQFRTACRVRLGMDVFLAPPGKQQWPCRSCKNGVHDALGHHASICPGKYGNISRHEVLKYCVLKFIKDSGYRGAMAEPLDLDRKSHCRPADIYVPGWKGGDPAWIDVSFTSPLGKKVYQKAAVHPGYASQERESFKRKEYLEASTRDGATFCPFVLEEFGGFGKEAVAVIKTVARGYAGHRSLTLSEATSRMVQRLSFESQKSLANAIEARKCDATVV